MKRIIFILLLTLAVNAVLIQTVLTENDLFKNLIRVGILGLSLFFMVITKQRIYVSVIFLLCISGILLLTRGNSDQLTYIFIFLFIHSFVLIDSKRIEKYLLVSSFASLALVFVFLFLGITENTVLDFRNRMTFGVAGVPFFYNLVYGFFTLWVLYSQKYYTKYKWLVILISLGASTYFFQVTDVRGGYFSFLAFLALIFIVKWTKKLSIARLIVATIPVISIGVALYIASLSNNINMNLTLSLRPILLANFFESLNWTDVLLSTSVKALDQVNIVDNSYLHLLVGGGLIISLFIGYLFYKAVLNLYKHKKYVEIAFIISTSLYFNMESIMVRVENMFIIYFWYLIIKYSITKVEVEPETVHEVKQKRRLFKRYKIVW